MKELIQKYLEYAEEYNFILKTAKSETERARAHMAMMMCLGFVDDLEALDE